MTEIFKKPTFIERIISVAICTVIVFLVGLFIWKLYLQRDEKIAAYAGCTSKSVDSVFIDYVNKNWKLNSTVYLFGYNDVVNYMMKNCSPKNDDKIESTYAYLMNGVDYYSDMNEMQEGLNRINAEKSVRNYQLKFLNKDLDVFRQ